MGSVLGNTLLSGILVGGFYCACAIGLSISFGMLRVPIIAHSGLVILGGFLTFFLCSKLSIDPLIAGLMLMPIFFLLGFFFYRAYYFAFESRKDEREGQISGLVMFFGFLLIIESVLSITFGVDFRSLKPHWALQVFHLGELDLPLRLVVPFLCSGVILAGVLIYFSKTYIGLVTRAIQQNPTAAKLIGANPVRAKSIAVGIGFGTAGFAGALFIGLMPVEPSMGVMFLGRVFSIAILGGLGSPLGTAVAALIIGVTESLTSVYIGSSWALGVSFALLLAVIALKPSGLFRR